MRAADPWGVPSGWFTVGYAVLFVAAFVVAALAPDRLDRTPETPVEDLRPVELAFLAGQDPLAVTTAIAALRADGHVDDDARPAARAPDRAPDGPLEAAVLAALTRAGDGGTARSLSTLLVHPRVHRSLRDLESSLDRRGLTRTPAEHRRGRRWSLLLWAVAALGIARLVALGVAGRPLGGGLLTVTGFAVAFASGMALVGASTPNRRAAATLRAARETHRTLRTDLRPVAPDFRTPDVALAVALFGWRQFTAVWRELGQAVELDEVFDPSTGEVSA